MKKTIITSGLFLAALLLVTSCKQDLIMFDSSMDAVGFSATTASVKEGTSKDITVYFAAPEGTAAVSVTVETSTTGIAKPAVEGTDYSLSTKTLDVPVGTAAITVNTIDNSIYEGDKKFYLTISSVSEGQITAQSTMTITVADDEHPLKNWIGTYDVAATSYGSPGNWDETWVVVTSPVDGHPDQLKLTGISNGTGSVIATFNKTTMTITITTPQSLGAVYGYDPASYTGMLYYGTDAVMAKIGAPGWGYNTDGVLDGAKGTIITGTIEATGTTILLDKLAPIVQYSTTRYIVWDAFNTTWTKR